MNLSEFEQTLLRRMGEAHFDIQTDNYGQIVIYTGLAETKAGDLVEFDSTLSDPHAVYRVGESCDDPDCTGCGTGGDL